MDSDKVFAEMCENCHGQNGIGGEVKEVEPIGVHDVAKEIREWRAEPAVEEHGEERIPVSWSCLRGDDGEYLCARMRPRLRRPEEIVPLPQLLRGELGGGKVARSFRSASSHCASVDFTAFAAAAFVAFPFPGFGGMAEAVGEIDGAGGGDGDRSGALLSFDFGRRGSGGDFRD